MFVYRSGELSSFVLLKTNFLFQSNYYEHPYHSYRAMGIFRKFETTYGADQGQSIEIKTGPEIIPTKTLFCT